MTGHPATPRRLRRARGALLGARSRVAATLRKWAAVRASPRWGGIRWISAALIVLFLLQVISGTLLSLYYNPDPGGAYDAVRYLTARVPAGWFVRSVHRWTADLLLAGVLLHLVVVYMRRTYVRPREYVWLAGVVLLLLVLGSRFTGRLLPWDTLGYEGTRRGLELLESVPLLGHPMARWLRGGEVLGANSLGRFFTTHVFIFPWLFAMLGVAHLQLLRRHGLGRPSS